MDRIRLILFVVGLVLFGLGMILAGLIKISNNQSAAGFSYLLLAFVLIVFLTAAFMYGSGKRKG